MDDILGDLIEAWSEAEKVDKLNIGDTAIIYTEDTKACTVLEVTSKFLRDGLVHRKAVRLYKRAPIELDVDVFAIIAEFKDDTDYGRWLFQRTKWDGDTWINGEGTTVTLDELTNIRAVKDVGEFL